MTKSYLTLLVVAALLALPVSAHAADVTLTLKSRSALKGVKVSPLKFPVRSVTVARGIGTVELGGSLGFAAGKRKATFSALRLTTGTTSSTLSGKLGKTRLSVFSARGKPVLGANSVALSGATLKLTPVAAAKLKRTLKLRRAPSTGTLGTLDLPAPKIAAPPPAPSPAPTATPTPNPVTPACADFAATPVSTVDWFGCDQPGNGDLKSWTNYVQRQFPPLCGDGPGTITASDGAQRLQADSAYDHRFAVTSAVRSLGKIVIQTAGSVTYTMPYHGIDESIANLRIEIAADGRSGQVFADGRSQPRNQFLCPDPAVAYTPEHVLDLDFTGITPVVSGLVTRWVHVPAKITVGTEKVGGDVYDEGANWGSFTIAIPTL